MTSSDPHGIDFKYHIPSNGLMDDGSFLALCGKMLGKGLDYYRYDSETTCKHCRKVHESLIKRSNAMAWP